MASSSGIRHACSHASILPGAAPPQPAVRLDFKSIEPEDYEQENNKKLIGLLKAISEGGGSVPLLLHNGFVRHTIVRV